MARLTVRGLLCFLFVVGISLPSLSVAADEETPEEGFEELFIDLIPGER